MGPRRRRPKQIFSQAQYFAEDDDDVAEAVCQVVKDLVCQVADEPYGDLTRKRPSMFNVLRKFVKDSMQEHHDAAAAEYLFRTFRRTKWEPEEETPYGIELVWGMCLSEMEKADKKEKARLYSAQKNARLREKKKIEALEALEAELNWEKRRQEALTMLEQQERELEIKRAEYGRLLDRKLSMDSGSSEEEGHREKPMSKHINPYGFEADPSRFGTTMKMSPSPRSDDSDWAEISRPVRTVQVQRPPIPNYPIFSAQRGRRGRGRPIGSRNAVTVRSMIENAGPSPSRMHNEMHPHVSLHPAGQLNRLEPEFEFSTNKVVAWSNRHANYVIKDPVLPREMVIPRGKNRNRARGGFVHENRNLRLIKEAWDVDAEEYQQHLMAESIESSGDNASQESNNDISNTINEVLLKVNEMRELDEKRRRRKRAKMNEEGEEEKVTKVSRSSTISVNNPSASTGMNKTKTDVVTIDSGSEDEQDNPSLFTIDPLLNSSFDEPLIPKSNANPVEGVSASNSSSDIFIID